MLDAKKHEIYFEPIFETPGLLDVVRIDGHYMSITGPSVRPS